MRSIKQKNEEYSKYVPSWETLIDKLLYNPLGKRRWKRKMGNGYYYRLLNGFLPIFEKVSGAKMSDFDMYYIAQSHLDAAWLFPVLDTKIRAFKTFYKAVEHIKKYPWFFTFAQTSPQYYNWIKHYDKNLWRKVKQFVKEERFEPVGGMWVEPTLDECWGEALVRQRLYGQHFYLREFGKISKMSSLLDVFGFPHSLPQILKKSGAEAFWTTKCTWNDQNPWPMANYMWRGVDGTEIFTHHFKFQYMAMADLGMYKKTARFPKPEKNQTVLNSHNTNEEIESCFSEDSDDRAKTLGIFYGWGDGARGPHEVEIGLHQLLAQSGHGKFTTMHNYFDILRKEINDRYLVWDDEMYLEFHRGCKTTQMEIKHYNRKSEIWAYAIEALTTLLNLSKKPEELADSIQYNKAQMFEIWRLLLFNQFHDILPGSSIPEVYTLAVKEQKKSLECSKKLLKAGLKSLLQGGESNSISFNPFCWNRSEYITDGEDLYFVDEIPALSVKVFDLKSRLVQDHEKREIRDLKDYYVIENDNIRAHVSKQAGTLISLEYKPLQFNYISVGGTYRDTGSGLRVYEEEIVQYDAWNIDPSYPRKNVDIKVGVPPRIETLEGGVRCVETTYEFLHSSATVQYFLYPKDDMLRIKIHTDVRDPKIMVKYFVPLTLESPWVHSEIPYASIRRSRMPESEMEVAKWEMPMQKWLDVSDQNCGLTVLNDNRYGFNATSLGVYITLTRTAKYPDPGYFSTFRLIPKKDRPDYTDLQPFDYQLGLLPHEEDHLSAASWRRAYDFNLPLRETTLLSNGSEENEASSTNFACMDEEFILIEEKNIIVGALKPPEFCGKDLDVLKEHDDWEWDGKTFVVRLVEQAGTSTKTKIRFNTAIDVKSVVEVDLLEMNPSEPLKVNKRWNSLKLEFHKFEIKTLLVTLK